MVLFLWTLLDDMSVFEKTMQKVRDVLPIVVQLAGILVVLANLWLVSKLAPMEQSIAVMAQEISEIKSHVSAIESQHVGFVTKDTFNVLVTRIDHISNRVDQIYGLLK